MTTDSTERALRNDRIWAATAIVPAALAGTAQPDPLLVALVALALLPWALVSLGVPLPVPVFAVLGIGPVAAVVAIAGTGAAVFLVTLAGSRLASRLARPSALAALAVVAAGIPFLELVVRPFQPGIAYFAVGDLLGLLLGVLLGRTERLAAELRAADARLAEAAGQAERERIARDVHDLVAHSLTVVVLHIGGARRLLRAEPAAAERALEDAERVCRDSLDGIRGVVGLLRDEHDGRPLSLDLEALAAVYRDAGVPVRLDVDGDPAALPLALRVSLYRVLQEALANAARYAAPGPVDARVTVGADDATVRVVNAMAGAASPRGAGGFGLPGLREQVAARSGTLTSGPREGRWVVECRLPLPRHAAAPA